MATIRRALPADSSAILALLDAYSKEVETHLDEDHLAAAMMPLIEQPELGDLLVADQNGSLVGYVVITWGWGIESGGAEALVDEMFVTSEFRNQGVGTLLMTAAIERAREKEVKVVFLETESNNPESRVLYDRLGFELESSIWMSRRI